jgi:hypothetical protein
MHAAGTLTVLIQRVLCVFIICLSLKPTLLHCFATDLQDLLDLLDLLDLHYHYLGDVVATNTLDHSINQPVIQSITHINIHQYPAINIQQ